MTNRLLTAALALAASAAPAFAQVVTFDNLATNGIGFMPSPHAGFNWFGFAYMRNDFTAGYNGFTNGVVSGRYVGFNNGGGTATIQGTSAFTFNSAYFTAGYNNGLNITLTGFNGPTLLFTRTITVNTTGPTLFNFNWTNLTQVNFHSSGGTPATPSGWDVPHWAVDNMVFNNATLPVIPLPPAAAAGLATLGLLASGQAFRRRRA